MQQAAFFRVEGTLLDRPALAAAAWLAGNARGLGERALRLGNVAFAAPLSLASSLASGATATRVTWMGLRGMTEDRVEVLAEEYYDEYVQDDLMDVGRRLLDRARKDGRRIVLLSDNIEQIAGRLAEALEADDLICNRLEISRGKATGRLEEPVVGSHLAGQWARGFAKENDIDLDLSWAYGAHAADSLLLSAIGKPCVVDPDFRLRRIARDNDWPVVER